MTKTTIPDSAIPKALREALDQRRRAAFALREAISLGICPSVFQLVDQLADMNRSLRQREWLARVTGFDPIAMGM